MPTAHALQQKPLTADFLVVCEGAGDVAFFKYFCQERNIEGYSFEETGGGNSGFQRYFEGLLGRSDVDRLRGVIAVSDNDDAPDRSFEAVRNQIKKAKCPAPNNPLEIAKSTTISFRAMVMMIPFTVAGRNKGCLETLLLKSVVDHRPDLARCIEDYRTCAGVNAWTSGGSKDKLSLRCILSAAWPDDPNLGLQYALNPDRGLIPLAHGCFDAIAGALVDFKNGIQPPGATAV